MTKEELIEQALMRIGIHDGTNEIGEYMSGAMDVWAKQFAEELIDWLNDNEFKSTRWAANLQSAYLNDGNRMPASEIIELFLKSKQ